MFGYNIPVYSYTLQRDIVTGYIWAHSSADEIDTVYKPMQYFKPPKMYLNIWAKLVMVMFAHLSVSFHFCYRWKRVVRLPYLNGDCHMFP